MTERLLKVKTDPYLTPLDTETKRIFPFDCQKFFSNVFNGCYAVLMFIVVIFFLIYGVEVYFKVSSTSFIFHSWVDVVSQYYLPILNCVIMFVLRRFWHVFLRCRSAVAF